MQNLYHRYLLNRHLGLCYRSGYLKRPYASIEIAIFIKNITIKLPLFLSNIVKYESKEIQWGVILLDMRNLTFMYGLNTIGNPKNKEKLEYKTKYFALF